MHSTILLADDHVLLRNALASLINTFPGFNVINMAADGTEVMELIEKGPVPAIVVLDLNMPKMDGYDTADWLHKTHPEIKILVITMFDSEVPLIRLLQVGVCGFLKKDIHPDELKAALVSVATDGFYYSHETVGKIGILFKNSKDRNISIQKSLFSDVEINFLKLASTELTYKEIAKKMKLTPRIIDNCRDSLFNKLNVKSRVCLAIYAVKNGLVVF